MAEECGVMKGSVLHVADHLRINRPWIGAPGSVAEIPNGSGEGTPRDKITGFGQTSYGGEDTTAELPRKSGDKVAETMKGQGDSIFYRAVVHCEF